MSDVLSTPVVIATDPRGLPVRSVRYYRRSWAEVAVESMERTLYHGDGRVAAQYDARSIERNEPIRRASNAFGTPWTWGADAGEVWGLAADTGQPLWSQDARGIAQAIVYDMAGRLKSRHEVTDGISRCLGRYEYGYAGGQMADANLSDRAITTYDEAGKLELKRVSLTGQVQESRRRLLKDDTDPDWPEEEGSDDTLTPGVAMSSATYDALGAWLTQTDASGNVQSVERAVDGLPLRTSLTPAGRATRPLATALHYGPSEELMLQETANGVVRRWTYDDRDGRLLSATTTARHGVSLMQDLRYSYDRVGNILTIDDAAQPIVFFRGSRVSSTRTFTYDAFYQLIEASGREHASAEHGPRPPDLVILPGAGSNAIRAYTRTYHYDEGGNLFKMHHNVPSDMAASFTTTMVVAPLSNRALPTRDGLESSDIDGYFDACGNPHHLQPGGQALHWNGRGCLREVVTVARATDDNSERYLYDSKSQRVRKRWRRQVAGVQRLSETLYLGTLERRFNEVTNEQLEVATATLGHDNARYLHWFNGERPDAIRYNIDDHQGSSSMELDENGDLVAYEEYYPYGGTSLQAARSVIEVDYRTVRYSGKERDATGLYYYGYRYYAPWLQRWLNPDPAGEMDGLNLYWMLQNNPVTFRDKDGLQAITGEYELTVGLKEKLKLKAALWWTRNVRNKKMKDFKVVEVGDDRGYFMTSHELEYALKQYNRLYNVYAKNTSLTKGNNNIIDNLELGETISFGALRNLEGKFPEESNNVLNYKYKLDDNANEDRSISKDSYVSENRYFALLRKIDKDNYPSIKNGDDKIRDPSIQTVYKYEREIYGIAVIGVDTEGEMVTAYVKELVAHPNTQIDTKYLENVDGSEGGIPEEMSVRGLGTYLMMKSLKRIGNSTNLKTVRADAQNIRSAAIAKRLGASVR